MATDALCRNPPRDCKNRVKLPLATLDVTAVVYPLYIVAAAEEDSIGNAIDSTTFALDAVRWTTNSFTVVDVIETMVTVGVIPLIGTVAPAIIVCCAPGDAVMLSALTPAMAIVDWNDTVVTTELEGLLLGEEEGCMEGCKVGWSEGYRLGCTLGLLCGCKDGRWTGRLEGMAAGCELGLDFGTDDG